MLTIDETIERRPVSAGEDIAPEAPPGRCTALRRDGLRCLAPALPGESACIGHSVKLAAKRHAGRIKGGKNRSNLARAAKRLGAGAMSLNELDAALANLLRGLAEGSVEPGVAVAASSLARAIVSAKTTAELAERIAALEMAEGIDQ